MAIAENGDRQFDLLAPVDGAVRDLTPAVSPDGTRIVFASTRDRATGTSLWIATLGVEVVPRRLTTGDAIDASPQWTPDGAAIVFASTRDGGDFDLWRIPATGGAPTALTSGAQHEVYPSLAPDGSIVYAALDPQTRASRIEWRAPSGAITRLTPGPDEQEPAVSPDGKLVAFTSSVARGEVTDSELWIMDLATKQAKQVANLPPTNEIDPRWSRDGRYLFATSLLGSREHPLFTSIIFIDRDEQPIRVRILRDTAGPLKRMSPAIATALDAATLRGDPEYLPELANVIAREIARQQMQK